MTTLIRVPSRFYVDHMERALPTPKELGGNSRHVWISKDDPFLSSLLSDAEYYSDKLGPDNCDAKIISSAKATVKAILNERYDPVANVWQTVQVPPSDRELAKLLRRKLFRKFGSRTDCAASVTRRPSVTQCPVRRVWLSKAQGYNLRKGMARQVHDISHHIFRRRHPGWRPHEHGHETLELEMAVYVASIINELR